MNRKIRVFVSVFVVAFVFSVLAQPTLARPSEPLTYDYAVFVYDPYPIGPNTMTIDFRHDSYCNMYIYLYKFDSLVRSWTVDRYTRQGTLYYSASVDAVWILKCYMSGYQQYVTDETRDTFGISDPELGQNNLAADWARHPKNWEIYKKAINIIDGVTDPYDAAYEIYEHVLDHFDHSNLYDVTFRSDLDLLDDLNTYDQYRGVCRSDAVILTSYARAVGIPARIIYLEMFSQILVMPPGSSFDPHYFAEFYIPNASGTYKWIPVDGDPIYNWFDQPNANEEISAEWPPETWPQGKPWWMINTMKIIIEIPYGGIEDDIPPDCKEAYPNWSQYYTNEL